MEHAAISKITRPRLSKVLPRKRLFKLLDKGRRLPVTWVSGPAGSGKTTLVASYLDTKKLPCLWYQLDEGDGDVATFFYYLSLAAKTASPRRRTRLPLLTMEYRGDVPAFTRRYFENLCSRLKPPFVIVLDNYHRVAHESTLHNVIREALSVVPDNIAMMIISRSAPPPSLALLKTYDKINFIEWDELKFDMSETRSLLLSGRSKALSKEMLARVHSMTTGWAAGLVLLMERLKTHGIAPEELDRFKPYELFDYFAAELFEKTERDMQDFLLKTAFLPRIFLHAAVELTGRKDAGSLLAALRRNHFFTEQRSVSEPVYEYHPLFREFLRARAWATYSQEEMLNILRRAAVLLDGSGEVEAAAELYRSTEEWEKFVRLILANASSIISQGRNRTLEEWLKSLPAAILDNDPWLLFWMGMCRMPFNLREGRQCFEKSFDLFRKRHDAAGVFLSWSGAIESIIQEVGNVRQLDPWITLFDELMKEYVDFPSPQIEVQTTSCIFMALWMCQPWHPQFNVWRNKALALLDGDADISRRMITGFYVYNYHYWVGDFKTCEHVIDIMRRITRSKKEMSPLAYNVVIMTEAWFAWVKGSFTLCSQNVQEGLEKSKESGVHIWDNVIMISGVITCLCTGDLPGAETMLDTMAAAQERARLIDKFYYHHLVSWRYFLMDDIPQALNHQEQASAFSEKIGLWCIEGLCKFAEALLLRATGEHKKAREHISECMRIGRKYGSKYMEFRSNLLEAAVTFDEGDEKAGTRYLRESMALAREKGYVYFVWWPPSLMTNLCVKALETGIETEFVQSLIRKCNLVPEEPPFHIEDWPWPIKIRTLGRFEILKDEKPVQFHGKVQKKPLEMLKALIAFGGKDVIEEQVTDALWPDADGDTGRSSFKTTLHRLRHLLGREESIRVQEGRMSLNNRYCWVDACAFERMIDETEKGTRVDGVPPGRSEAMTMRRGRVEKETLLENATALYRGHFLVGEDDKPWAVSLRERLQNKFLRAMGALGESWEREGKFKKAVECYQKGLEVDDLAEEFYQRLMVCYQKNDRKADAIKTYERCVKTFSAVLGVEPSTETKAIYSDIRNKK